MYPLNGQHATKDKDVSLAEGPHHKANGSYQFTGIDKSYIEFPFNAGTFDALHSITMLCWVYISQRSISTGFLLVYYNKNKTKQNENEGFCMAIENDTLAAYFSGTASPDIQSERLYLNHWHYVGVSYDHTSQKASLWVNGTVVKELTGPHPRWNDPGIGCNAVSMGALRLKGKTEFKFKGRIAAMQVYNVSLTKQQIKAMKYVSGRGKKTSYKASVCKRT